MAEARYEYYNSGDDNFTNIYSPRKRTQSFTPATSHTLSKIRLKLGKRGTPPSTLYVEVYAADESDYPTGSILSSGSIGASSISAQTSGVWYDIAMSSYLLSSGTKYVIVLHTNGLGTDGNDFIWRFDSTGAYSGGMRTYWDGSQWIQVSGADAMFEEYGDAATVYTKTFDVNAALNAGRTKAFDANAALYGNLIKTFDINAALNAGRTKTFSVNAMLLSGPVAMFSVNAALIKNMSKVFSANALILAVGGVSDEKKTLMFKQCENKFGLFIQS